MRSVSLRPPSRAPQRALLGALLSATLSAPALSVSALGAPALGAPNLTPAQARAALEADLRAHPEDYWAFELAQGHYLIAPRAPRELDELNERVLIGRPQSLHVMRVRGSGGEFPRRETPVKWSLYLSDLHLASAYQGQSLEFSHPTPEPAEAPSAAEEPIAPPPRPAPQLGIECQQTQDGEREEVKRPLRMLSAEESGAVLGAARVVERPRLPYYAERLFRDDWGRYYLVERRAQAEAGPLLRLWVGYRGALEQIATMIAAEDSRGVVLVSQDAALRLVASGGRADQSDVVGAYWVDRRGDKPERRELLEVPVEQNQGVIYNTFGLYDTLYLGSPCDPIFGRLQPEPRAELPPSDALLPVTP